MIGYFEEIEIGERIEVGSHLFTAEEIKRYARRFDPQPFHVDEAAAASSLFGALCASGWQTAMIWARLMAEHRRRLAEERSGEGMALPRLGPSPALRQLQWLKPVYVGDVISYVSEVEEKREPAEGESWGLVALRNTGVNQAGELVISFRSEVLVERVGEAARRPV